MRVGARASTRSGIETPGPRPVTVQDGLRVALRLERHEDARLPESVDRERVQDMADVGRKAYGDAVELQDALDELGFEVAPGSVHDDGHGFVHGSDHHRRARGNRSTGEAPIRLLPPAVDDPETLC